MTTSTTQSIRIGPLLAAGLLVFGALLSLIVQIKSGNEPAAQTDWDLAAEAAVELSEATDGIRVHPSWSEAALPALRPVGNLLHRHHRPLLEDLLGIERLLILTETKRRDEALNRLPFEASVDHFQHFGTVELLAVTIPENLRIVSDLTGVISEATVGYLSEDDGGHPCRWSTRDGVWHCDRSRSAARVGPLLLELENDPRRCIQAYPPSDDQYLSVEMTIEEASDILRIRAGLDNRAARLPTGDDVIYRVFVNDASIAEERINGHTSIWKAHDIATPEFTGGPIDVRIEVESVAPRPHHRRFCFNAWPMTFEQAEM